MYKTCFVFCALLFGLLACQRKPGDLLPGAGNDPFGYGDSVFYLKPVDYNIRPNRTVPGTYTAVPNDLNIDNSTGAITVSVKGKSGKASQTGLRYRVVFTPATGSPDTCYLVLAGINYQDKIYLLESSEAWVRPVYNASHTASFSGGRFSADNNKLIIDPATGAINIKQSVAAGLFKDDPQNAAWRVVNIRYGMADGSANDKNNLDVVLYYYTAVQNIPANISSVMRAHQDLLFGLTRSQIPETFAPEDDDIKGIVSASKPRPPCIIIIGN